MRLRRPVLGWALGVALAGAAAAQTMPTRPEGILSALCIQTQDKACPGGPAPTGTAPRQIEIEYRTDRDEPTLDPKYAENLAAALRRPELVGQCFDIAVEGAHQTTREYAIALTHRHAVRIEAILVQNGVAKERLNTIGLGKPGATRVAGEPPFRAILKTRLGPC